MAYPKGAPKVGGRKKGSLNKTTLLAKEAIAKVFDDMGGAEAMLQWAQSGPDERKVFYGTIYPKLLPIQLTGGSGGPVQLEMVNTIVDPKRDAG